MSVQVFIWYFNKKSSTSLRYHKIDPNSHSVSIPACELIDEQDYHFDFEIKSYSEAKNTCQNIGGKLFEPKSEKVYDCVSALAKTKGISIFWLGIHDISNEGKFTYESDGKAVDWTNWHKGEPNDFRKGEDCTRSGHGHNDVNKWNDSPCEREKYSVVCEKSGIPTLIL